MAVVAWLVSGVLRAQEFRVMEALARMEASAHGYVPSVTLDLKSSPAPAATRWYSFDQHWGSLKSGLGSLIDDLKLRAATDYGDGPALMSFVRRRIYSDDEDSGLLFKHRLLEGERSIVHVRAGYGLYFGPSIIPTTQPCVGGVEEQRFLFVKSSFYF